MEILLRLKELQSQRGWSDYRIAKEAGLSPNTVSNVFRRNNIPEIATLAAICKAFGLTLAQFFAEDNLIELTPELRMLFDKWSALTDLQKDAIWQIMKSYEK